MSTWHFYRLADGLFAGASFSGLADDLEPNLPPGHGAALGVTDWQRQRVCLDTGELLPHEPPGPSLAEREADARGVRLADLTDEERDAIWRRQKERAP